LTHLSQNINFISGRFVNWIRSSAFYLNSL